MEALLPRGCESDPLDELLEAISRSLNLSDVDETDICEWLADNPDVREIAPGQGFCSDLITRLILEHTTRRPCFATPSLAQNAYEMRPDPPSADKFLVSGIVI